MATDATTELLEAAIGYAERGWHVVPLYNPIEGGGCSCEKRGDCPSIGKHPRINAWQRNSSTDERQITQWWEKWPTANIGVQLGEKSNLLDIECDNSEAEQNLVKLLGDDPPVTPTYQSHRSKHRLFRWRDELPPQAVIHIGHIEVRLGNGDKGAQSVFPPSLHGDGRRYRWLVPPDEVEAADLPKEVLAKLWNLAGEESLDEKSKSIRQALYEQPQVVKGTVGRDTVIYAEACAMWREQWQIYGSGCLESPDVQSTVYRRLWAFNQAMCQPPLDDNTVLEKCENARNFLRSETTKEVRKAGPSLEALGLEHRNGEYFPGTWRAEAINSDPPITRLYARFLPEGHLDLLTKDEFGSAARVNAAIRGATGTVCLADGVRPWKDIWEGYSNKVKKIFRRGLCAKLLDVAAKVEAPKEQKQETMIAAFVCGYLDVKARPLNEDGAPPGRRRPFYTPDGCAWFSFAAMLKEAKLQREDDVTRNVLSKLLRGIGIKEEKYPPKGDDRSNYWMMQPRALARLRELAGGESIQDTTGI